MLLAEKLTQVLTRRDGRCALVATFIHRVVPTLETISSLRSRKSNKAAWLAAWRDQNIFFNRTHVGMAVQVRVGVGCEGRVCMGVGGCAWMGVGAG